MFRLILFSLRLWQDLHQILHRLEKSHAPAWHMGLKSCFAQPVPPLPLTGAGAGVSCHRQCDLREGAPAGDRWPCRNAVAGAVLPLFQRKTPQKHEQSPGLPRGARTLHACGDPAQVSQARTRTLAEDSLEPKRPSAGAHRPGASLARPAAPTPRSAVAKELRRPRTPPPHPRHGGRAPSPRHRAAS